MKEKKNYLDFSETVDNFDQSWLLLKPEIMSSSFIISSVSSQLTLQDKKSKDF